MFILVFSLSSKLVVPSRCLFPPPPKKKYTRTADHNVTPPTSTQYSAQHRATINSSAHAALDIMNSLVAPNHRSLLSASFKCLVAFLVSCASEAGGVSPPRSGALVPPTNRRVL